MSAAEPLPQGSTVGAPTSRRDTVDWNVVERVAAGEPRPRRLTYAEGYEVARRLARMGYTTGQMSQRFGIKSERYAPIAVLRGEADPQGERDTQRPSRWGETQKPAWSTDGVSFPDLPGAECAQVPHVAELFFADERTHDSTKALMICRRCPAVRACLAWALKHNEQGIWGATTTQQRDELRHRARVNGARR